MIQVGGETTQSIRVIYFKYQRRMTITSLREATPTRDSKTN